MDSVPTPAHHRLRRSWLAPGASLGLLWVLTFGLFAHDRGFFRDEVWIFNALRRSSGFADRWLYPGGTAGEWQQRILTGVPFAFAALFPAPELVLQLLYGLARLAGAAAAAALATTIVPRSRWVAFAAAALALCATGDASVNCAAALVAHGAAAAYVAALAALLVFWRGGSKRWLLGAGAALSASVWSYDAALPAASLTPAVLWALEGLRPSRRLFVASSVWYAFLAPYLLIFARFVGDPHSYAARTLRPLTPNKVLSNTWELFAENFMPWDWARLFRNPDPDLFAWGLRPPAAMLFVGVALGTLAFLLAAWRLWPQADEPETTSRVPGSTGALLILALVSNLGYAWVGDSLTHFRTQLVSRLLVSAVIALTAFGLRRWGAWLSHALVALFVGWGVLAGLTSQVAYLGVWRRQKFEMRALLHALPARPAHSTLVVYVPPEVTGLAFTAGGANHAWLTYLYGQQDGRGGYVWSEKLPQAQCQPQVGGLICGADGSRLPYESTIILSYRPASDDFVRTRAGAALAPALLQALETTQPNAEVMRALSRHEWLGRYLPAPNEAREPLPAEPAPLCSVRLLSGWRHTASKTSALERWMDRRAVLEIGSFGNQRLSFRASLGAVFPPDTVTVRFNSELTRRLQLDQPGQRLLALEDLRLRDGLNYLTFVSSRPAGLPLARGGAIPYLMAHDMRAICTAVP